jgi:hypothetical protein
VADITCTFQGDKDAGGRVRPARAEFALFRSAADQAAAYSAIASPTHLRDTGNCSTGPCEYPFSGAPGRKVVFGTPGSVELAAYQPADGRMLLIASGGRSAGQINTWYQNTADFAPRGFLVTGF